MIMVPWCGTTSARHQQERGTRKSIMDKRIIKFNFVGCSLASMMAFAFCALQNNGPRQE